jgi:tetratricopeptide (TPR) repeat protein
MGFGLRWFALLALLSFPAIAPAFLANLQTSFAENPAEQAAFEKREAAYRANNVGVALLEQYKAKEAVNSFQDALQQKPDLLIARINLAIALYYLPDAEQAKHAAETALKQDANSPQAHYILGLLARAANRLDESVAEFQKVLTTDGDDVGTNVNLGQIFVQQRRYPEAIAAFRKAIETEPYNETALYNLGLLLTRTGKRDEGQQLLQKFQQLKASGAGTLIGTNYLEGGHYAEAVVSTGAETELIDKSTPKVSFTDITTAALPPFREARVPRSFMLGAAGGAATLFDFDGDGDLDLIEVQSGAQRLFRNDGGWFTDVTNRSGALAKNADGVATAVIAGDVDNDGKPDLFVLRFGSSSLYHNDGKGHFSDVTVAAKIPAYPYLARTAAFVDYDHDGDLDLLIPGGEDVSNALPMEKDLADRRPKSLYTMVLPTSPTHGLLLRNNGNRTFTDVTAQAKLAAPNESSAVVPTDYDNRRDVDLLVSASDGIKLWRNMRDGTFRDVARDAGLKTEQLRATSSVAVGDINKDGYPDFFFGIFDWAGCLALSDGRGHFQIKRGPDNFNGNPNFRFGKSNRASELIDYDNDGLLDLVTVVEIGEPPSNLKLRVWRNVGDGWKDVSDTVAAAISAVVPKAGRPLLLASDLDGDGDTDLIFGTVAGGLHVLRNDGGNRNRSIKVDLRGRVSNRSAVQAKIEMRAGSLYSKLENYSASPAPAPADFIFGLGKRQQPDAVRVIWPAGIVQAETEFPAKRGGFLSLNVTELDRKPSSCPYLYSWNGQRFEFVTDFMGGGEIGYLEEPGVYNTPDPDEYVRIRADQLREKDGRFELRVTNELEESMFVDRLRLIAIDHPRDVLIFPNEGMSNPPKPFKLFATADARPPLTVVDDKGNDVLDLVARMDRRWPSEFAVDRIRGYAADHTLTMRLPERDGLVLFLTGWTDYAWSSDNLAASQARKAMTPPSLQVKDREGKWRTVIEDIGIPVGRPQTVTVDLAGKFLSANREVRIVTNMRIYWDQILVGTTNPKLSRRMTRLDPVSADLRWRGFSAEITADGREPFGYDYKSVSYLSPWKTMTGHYTRLGDVRELLLNSDDMFVISRPGDEISLSFDATALPRLQDGLTRTFLLYADGFSKEMDINSASPDQLAPLPFHGMSRYPYFSPEHYPTDAKHLEYLEKYNTRVVSSQVPGIMTELLQK